MKDWKGNERSIYVSLGASNHSTGKRAERDFYATSPEAVRKLLDREKFPHNILEPCCGMGHISEVLKEYGYSVICRDIVDRGYEGQDGVWDFLVQDEKLSVDAVVTNPPYSLALEFCKKSLDMVSEGGMVAMFLKLTFLEGQKRLQFFKKNPPRKILVFSKRVACGMNGVFSGESSAICYAWFIWEKGYSGSPEIGWIE